MFHIVAVTSEGLRIIGPFERGELAMEYGVQHFIEDLRWNVAEIGEPADYGMAHEEPFNTPHFVVEVEAPGS